MSESDEAVNTQAEIPIQEAIAAHPLLPAEGFAIDAACWGEPAGEAVDAVLGEAFRLLLAGEVAAEDTASALTEKACFFFVTCLLETTCTEVDASGITCTGVDGVC